MEPRNPELTGQFIASQQSLLQTSGPRHGYSWEIHHVPRTIPLAMRDLTWEGAVTHGITFPRQSRSLVPRAVKLQLWLNA